MREALSPTTFGRQFTVAGQVIYSLNANILTGWDSDTLEEVYRAELSRGNVHNYIVFHQMALVLFGDQTLSLYELEPKAREIWHISSTRFSWDYWPPVVAGNTIFLSLDDGSIRQVDVPSGRMQAVANFPENMKSVSAPAYSKQRIYWIFSDGTLRSYDTQNTKQRILLKSQAVRYPGSGNTVIYYPKVAIEDQVIVVSFGCKKVFAVQEE